MGITLTPILAEAVTNNDVITWGIILTITTILANVAGIAIALSNRKQKREVSFEFEPASKEEFDKHVEKNEREHAEIRALREKDADAAGDSRKRVYDKLEELEKQMNAMPGKIVADILNTKKLFGHD